MGETHAPIPNRLKKYRRMMGFSQKDVARKLGFKTTNRISRWEKGEAMPSAKNLLKLSMLYRTLPAQLYDELYDEFRELLKRNRSG